MGGNRQTMLEGATVRNYYAGHGNFTGQMAVRLVQSGFTRPRGAPSVTFGQWLADDFKPAQVIADLGREWTLATRVEVVEVPEFTAEFHARQMVELKITCKDGKTFRGGCEVTRGESGNPHVPADIEKKFNQFATPVWGDRLARDVYQGCMTLETIPDVREFFADLTL